MTMIRFDPLEELRPVPVGTEGEATVPVPTPQAEGPLAYDVYRVDDELCIDFDAPGVAPRAIHLTLEEHILTVSVERELHDAGVEVIERGRVHGAFRRRLVLPGSWDVEELRATYENGVVHLSAPLRRSGGTRIVAIDAPHARPVADDRPWHPTADAAGAAPLDDDRSLEQLAAG